MVVYEIKNPLPPIIEPAKIPDKVTKPVDEINPVVRINQFKSVWDRRKNKNKGEKNGPPVSRETAQAVRRLIHKLNQDLELHNIPIHLTLIQEVDGSSLDIYDSSDPNACVVVGEFFVPRNEIPSFVHSLEQEAGIMVDRVS